MAGARQKLHEAGQHASHPAVIRRLKRAHGHLARVIAMIEEERPCREIAQQMQAVEKAIVNAKRGLIHDHIDHCLQPDETGAIGDLSELRLINKYL